MPIKTKKSEKKEPKLRFSGFSGEWEEKKLGEVFTDIKSGKDKPEGEGEYTIYGSTGVIGMIKQFTYNGEYILIARVGANAGKINRVDGKFGVTDNTLVLDGQVNVSIDFFYNFLKAKNLNRLVFGSGQPLITGGQLKKYKIIIPIIKEEQEKIGNFLGSVDEWIENLKEQKKFLESYKKGMMQKIFSQEIRFTNNGKDFPEWEEKKLGEIVKIQGGNAFKSILFKKSGIPIIRISNISNDYNVNLDNLVFYNRLEKENNFLIKKSDLLIAMSGATTGKVGVYNLDGEAYLNQRVGLFRNLDNNILDYSFLTQFVFSNFFSRQIRKVLVAGAQPNISPGDIEIFKINLPSVPEQRKIADFLTSLDNLIKSKQQQITQAESWKKGLTQGLFV